MPTTDRLTTMRDHPARLLQAHRTDMQQRGRIAEPEAVGITRAAAYLQGFEQMENVTFAALNNDALARVQEAYEHLHETSAFRAGDDLADAVRDLLGLDDDQ